MSVSSLLKVTVFPHSLAKDNWIKEVVKFSSLTIREYEGYHKKYDNSFTYYMYKVPLSLSPIAVPLETHQFTYVYL